MSNKSELPELENRGAIRVIGKHGRSLPNEKERTEIVHICNNWPHVKELVAELKGKCEGMGEYEWNELFEPVFDELKIVLEGEQ